MAISDDERREIARKLREIERQTLCELTDGELLDLLADKVRSGRYGSKSFDEVLFGRLADLIDRPTCSIKRGYQTRWGVCSRCGALVNAERAVSTATEYLPTRYCPNCGAEVVE